MLQRPGSYYIAHEYSTFIYEYHILKTQPVACQADLEALPRLEEGRNLVGAQMAPVKHSVEEESRPELD